LGENQKQQRAAKSVCSVKYSSINNAGFTWNDLQPVAKPGGGQSLAERGPLITVGGALAKTQKKLQNDSQSLDVVNVHTR